MLRKKKVENEFLANVFETFCFFFCKKKMNKAFGQQSVLFFSMLSEFCFCFLHLAIFSFEKFVPPQKLENKLLANVFETSFETKWTRLLTNNLFYFFNGFPNSVFDFFLHLAIVSFEKFASPQIM